MANIFVQHNLQKRKNKKSKSKQYVQNLDIV